MEEQQHRQLGLEFGCGALAGLVSDAAVHPIDTVRTNLMAHTGSDKLPLRRLLSPSLLYRGFGIVGAFTVPAHGLYFAGYEVSRRWIEAAGGQSDDDDVSERSAMSLLATDFAAGLAADVWGSLAWTPMDVVKQRVQLQALGGQQSTVSATSYSTSWSAVRFILREEGVRGLYKGYWAGLATYGPFVGLYFASYAQMKRMYCSATHQQETFLMRLVVGALAGALASAATTPLDVVKTRLQLQSNSQADRFAGIADCIRRTYRDEGVRGFWRGMVARTAWITPGCAITMAVYEFCKVGVGLDAIK